MQGRVVRWFGTNTDITDQKKIQEELRRMNREASGKAVAAGDSEGFVKVLLGEKYEEIIGAHIIGADATELIAEYTLAMSAELTADEINASIHAHPTLAEMNHEAVLAAEGKPIHI